MSARFRDDPRLCVDDPRRCVDDPRRCVDDRRLCVDDRRLCVDDRPWCVDDRRLCVDDRPWCVDDRPWCVDDRWLCVDEQSSVIGRIGPCSRTTGVGSRERAMFPDRVSYRSMRTPICRWHSRREGVRPKVARVASARPVSGTIADTGFADATRATRVVCRST